MDRSLRLIFFFIVITFYTYGNVIVKFSDRKNKCYQKRIVNYQMFPLLLDSLSISPTRSGVFMEFGVYVYDTYRATYEGHISCIITAVFGATQIN